MKKNSKGKKNSAYAKKGFPTLRIIDEKEIAMDFATKTYEKFNKLVKSIILFGSQTKNSAVAGSDIDIILIVDDASILWDQELIAWYREELGKLIRVNPYKKELHINSIKLTTWWQDLLRGDAVIMNILRFGEPLIDFGGFFSPLKVLLQQGKLKSTPESIYAALERVPSHILRSRVSELNAIEGLYWAMIDSSQAALMAAKQNPPSPEHIPKMLSINFVDKGLLKSKYAGMFSELHGLHKKILHGEITNLKGEEIDIWQEKTEEFVKEMVRVVNYLVS